MQLISNVESTMEGEAKMTTLDEPQLKNVTTDIDSLKKDIRNGNKENIQSQDNIISDSIIDSDKVSALPSSPVSIENQCKENINIYEKSNEENERDFIINTNKDTVNNENLENDIKLNINLAENHEVSQNGEYQDEFKPCNELDFVDSKCCDCDSLIKTDGNKSEQNQLEMDTIVAAVIDNDIKHEHEEMETIASDHIDDITVLQNINIDSEKTTSYNSDLIVNETNPGNCVLTGSVQSDKGPETDLIKTENMVAELMDGHSNADNISQSADDSFEPEEIPNTDESAQTAENLVINELVVNLKNKTDFKIESDDIELGINSNDQTEIRDVKEIDELKLVPEAQKEIKIIGIQGDSSDENKNDVLEQFDITLKLEEIEELDSDSTKGVIISLPMCEESSINEKFHGLDNKSSNDKLIEISTEENNKAIHDQDTDSLQINISSICEKDKLDESSSTCSAMETLISIHDQVTDSEQIRSINKDNTSTESSTAINSIETITSLEEVSLKTDKFDNNSNGILEVGGQNESNNTTEDNLNNIEASLDILDVTTDVEMDKEHIEDKPNESIEEVKPIENSNCALEGQVLKNKRLSINDFNIDESSEDGNTFEQKSTIEEAMEDIKDDSSLVNIRAVTDPENNEAIKSLLESITDQQNVSTPLDNELEQKKPVCKLSNTLDILSDDDDAQIPEVGVKKDVSAEDKQCISLEDDDDDIMLVDEVKDDVDENVNKNDVAKTTSTDVTVPDFIPTFNEDSELENDKNKNEKTETPVTTTVSTTEDEMQIRKEKELVSESLLPENFVWTAKKNLSDMTRDELEEFCILKIVESIVDRSNLSDMKSKLNKMSQYIEEQKRKVLLITKQNRDLQVVLKSVQEEIKKNSDTIVPLKITRSVGLQVVVNNDMILPKKKTNIAGNTKNDNNAMNKNNKTTNINTRSQRKNSASQSQQQIPVPRLVPANNVAKTQNAGPQNTALNNQRTNTSPVPILPKVSTPVQKAEKRPHSRAHSVTVDLTDDEPPLKVTPRISPAPPVRLVSPQSLLSPQRATFGNAMNSPRKVYIPISGPQGQLRPGQTIMLRSMGPRQRCPPLLTRMPHNQIRMRLPTRHPAPLPDAMKQYQPPNWKNLPPAPDLKLAKVENGIVLSWKIEEPDPDTYEEIASYQLYAYQETTAPPSTNHWKKIGDVKALALPMACTLTQFMNGYKYYFAVRAVDIRSRIGPFSLPGSIQLLGKM